VRSIAHQDHYELLEIPRSASAEQIDRAYRLACSIYVDDALAGHSVFEEGDVDAIRARLDVAYKTLSDAGARQAYDESLAPSTDALPAPVETRVAEAPAPAPLETLEDLDESEGEFDGARLRRLRLHRGREIEEMASETKINPAYLHCIEEDRFDDLPAAVYVRGFVMAYATCIGLDPVRVAESYLRAYQESRNNPRRRLFGRL
jgi:flagellar biosynthesis protein FlhG